MIKRMVVFFASKFKNRKVHIDESVSISYLINLLFTNIICALRGFLVFRKRIVVGKHVKLLSKKTMYISDGVNISNYVTLDGLGREGITIGKSSSIGAFSMLKVSGSLSDIGIGIKIGNNVGVGDFSHIGGAGGVTIGDDTIIGAYLSIHPENHIFNDKTKLIREQGVTRKGITIGSNCWIGAKVTVLDGSFIGNGSVVAAGSVVNGVFPENAVIGGVPARILKER